MKDLLGQRIKENYENRSKQFLPRRNYTIIRIDGKTFSTYTKGLKKPFCDGLMEDMDLTAAYLCKNIMGAKFAFVQSDEISILITDFENINQQAWFDNNVQKMCSISASMATAKFNQLRMQRFQDFNYKIAEFDSRVFQIPQKTEVDNYFRWRQQDTIRNSIQSVAYSMYSHSEINNKNTNEMQEMIFQKGVNWNDFKPRYKRGRIIVKELYQKENLDKTFTVRTRWVSTEPPIFTEQPEYLDLLIPNNR